jgi:hypothetical protein
MRHHAASCRNTVRPDSPYIRSNHVPELVTPVQCIALARDLNETV